MSRKVLSLADVVMSEKESSSEDEMILEKEYCSKCKNEIFFSDWCKNCESAIMKKKFSRWTSENEDIDKFIQFTQLNAKKACECLEWIPFESFEMVKYFRKGRFSTIYSASWIEGPRSNWNKKTRKWTRAGLTTVALKRIDDSFKISTSYINRIKDHNKCLQSSTSAEIFGVTKDPTSNYMIVMRFYPEGNLYEYVDKCNEILSWREIIDLLWGIAGGLDIFHSNGKPHGNLHGGNLLIEDDKGDIDARFGDVGLNGPCHYESNELHGVLPYVAPEVLRGGSLDFASDIYSFGIIMYTFAIGTKPWDDKAHDIELAKEICLGKRPEIPNDAPRSYVKLMKQCWDNNPTNRPTAHELNEMIGKWATLISDDPSSDIYNEITRAEEKRWIFVLNKEYVIPKMHPDAYYTSRSLHFPEL